MKNIGAIRVKKDVKKFLAMLNLMKKRYKQTKTVLHFNGPLEMLVATILSAQCTDVRVNMVTPALFKKYPTVKDYVNAKPEELQKDIRSTGFFRNKAKSIQGACRVMIEKYKGQVPKTMREMLVLPGIARKSANVILYNAYGVVEGIAVDTHVRRLSQRLGASTHNSPEKIEQDLMKIIPEKGWGVSAYLLIEHGRKVCKAVKPNCSGCFLNKLCPSAFSFNEKGKWIGL